VFAQYGIEHTGFTHIGAANNGNCAKLVGISGISVNSAIDAINIIIVVVV
jgi:hypothetical protein